MDVDHTWTKRRCYGPENRIGVKTLRDADLGKPVVVAANGHAIAGGMEMLLAGDIRVVSEREALELKRVRAQALATTEDAVEGPRSFLEKRPPVFKGR